MATIEKTEQGTYRVRWRNPQGRTRSRSFKTRKDAKRCLKRRIAATVWRIMLADERRIHQTTHTQTRAA